MLIHDILDDKSDPLHRTYLSFLILSGGRVTEAGMVKWKDLNFNT